MKGNTKRWLCSLTMVLALSIAQALHLLPTVIENFHRASPAEAKRIRYNLLHSGDVSKKLTSSFAVKKKDSRLLKASHQMKANLLELPKIPDFSKARFSTGLPDDSSQPTPHSAVGSRDSLTHHRSLVDKLVASDKLRQQLLAAERKLLYQENNEGEPVMEINFETTEIKDALDFIEFKMDEINNLMTECINREFENNPFVNADSIKGECVGLTYQILYYNYKEALVKVKDILIEILKIKLQNLKEDFLDETNFFLDMLEEMIDKDFIIAPSIQVAKKASKYYVSSEYFAKLMDMAGPEINAFDTIHRRLRESRLLIQSLLEKRKHEEVHYARSLANEGPAERKLTIQEQSLDPACDLLLGQGGSIDPLREAPNKENLI